MQAQAAHPKQPGGPTVPSPKAKFSVKTKHPRVHKPVVFDASASKVHGATSYSWSFGDGKQATGRRVSHQFAERGTLRR